MRWAGHVTRMGEEIVQGFGGKAKERDHLEDQRVDGRMGSEWILGRLAGGGVDWIQLAQDRVRLRALINTAMNLRVLAPRLS
jgi:hypothetical protein